MSAKLVDVVLKSKGEETQFVVALDNALRKGISKVKIKNIKRIKT